jgi:Zn-dependent protease/CBS domain-containing protein
MDNSIRLGRIGGIEIDIHYTWALAFALIGWSLAVGYFPSVLPDASAGIDWVLGIAAALLLFVSVLVHELSHSLVARRLGLEVDSITLFIFGGVSNLRTEATSARDEFLVAIVGPLSSMVLAALCWILAQALPAANPLGSVLSYLAFINLLLALFNLIPGLPLDGGRVLQSFVWGATGDKRRATVIAGYAGQAVGWLLILWGLARLLSGDFFGGLWTAFIGWFLNSSAESERHAQVQRHALFGVKVGNVMDPSPVVASPDLSVNDFVFDDVLQRGRRALLVVRDGSLVGIVTVGDARKLPQSAWRGTSVANIMTPAPLQTVSPDDDLNVAIGLLAEHNLHQLPVTRDAGVVGMLDRSDIMRLLQLRSELRLHDATASSAVQSAASALRG